LRRANVGLLWRCFLLSLGLRLDQEFGRAAQKQAGSETNRKQNAKTEVNEAFHKSHFRCNIIWWSALSRVDAIRA